MGTGIGGKRERKYLSEGAHVHTQVVSVSISSPCQSTCAMCLAHIISPLQRANYFLLFNYHTTIWFRCGRFFKMFFVLLCSSFPPFPYSLSLFLHPFAGPTLTPNLWFPWYLLLPLLAPIWFHSPYPLSHPLFTRLHTIMESLYLHNLDKGVEAQGDL